MLTARPTSLLKIAFSIVALLAVVSSTSYVLAQESQSDNEVTLTAIPPRLGDDNSLRVNPGEKLQTSVRVRNASLQPLQVDTGIQDFIVDEDGETPVPLDEEAPSRWSLAQWVTLSPQVSQLMPNEIGTINVIIEVPSDALPGGHYAMVTHQPTAKGNGPATQIVSETDPASRVNQRVGTLLYVIVNGPINEEAFIRNLTFPRFTEFGPVPFSFSVDNQSDIHITPQIGVEIYNFLGQKVDTIDVESKNIFPLMSRGFEGQWGRMWGIGPYTAKVIMSYGTGSQVVIANYSFWLFPISVVLSLLVILMALLVISIATRRHLHHRNDVNAQKVQMLEKRLSELEGKRIDELDEK